MIITIYEGYDKTYVMLGSKNPEFAKAWGSVVKIPASAIYKDLAQIASWCNNEIGRNVYLKWIKFVLDKYLIM